MQKTTGKKLVRDQTLRSLVAAIGADAPSPGSGAASGIALALAAACAGKATRISLKHNPGGEGLHAAEEEFGVFAERALKAADDDASAFEGYLAAHDVKASARLMRTDESILSLIDAFLRALHSIAPVIHETVRGDVSAARALAHAARSIQEHNIKELE